MTAVAIGNFDGVHRGHQALIARARELAAPRGERTLALTFHPHPSAVLSPHGAPRMLASLERRVELLRAAGADDVVVLPFTRELAALSPDQFVDDILLGQLGARAIVVGYDFNYGRGRAGSTQTLAAHCTRTDTQLAIVPPVEVAGEVCASSKVRRYLEAGDLAAAEAMLGRPWDIEGTVVHGAKRGRAIGIPTANIAPASDLVIAPGIYAVTLGATSGPPMPAVASLGTNPTFVEQGGLVLEVHVLDWDGDLYDQKVRTTFVARLRDEAKYEGVDALLVQIRKDIADARDQLRRAGHG